MIAYRILTLTGACILSSHVAVAAIYKTVDEHGNVVYTDDPAGHGKPVDLPPLSTVPPPKYQPAPASPAQEAKQEQSGAVQYQQLQITSPGQDETLRDNPGNIWLKAAVDPALSTTAGHRLQFYLDDKPVGEPQSSEKVLVPNVDRGAHTASVAVVDGAGKVVQESGDVRFYLHRQSVNFPTRSPAKP